MIPELEEAGIEIDRFAFKHNPYIYVRRSTNNKWVITDKGSFYWHKERKQWMLYSKIRELNENHWLFTLEEALIIALTIQP